MKVSESNYYSPKREFTRKGNINARATIIEFEHIVPAHNFRTTLSLLTQRRTQDMRTRSDI